MAEEMAGVLTLPQRLFGRVTLPNSDGDLRQGTCLPEALAVALVVPISDECAVCFSTRRLAATLPGEQESGAAPRASSPDRLSSADERGASGYCDASGGLPRAAPSCDGAIRAELALKMRGVEVELAMQESSLARKRRRQAKSVPGKGARGMNNPGSSISIAGVEDRRAGSCSGGGHSGSGSLSQRDSGSLCFTGEEEDTSGDGAACDVRQWRLEMEMGSVTSTSNGSFKSTSPRGYRLFNSTPGGAIAEDEDDDQMSSSGSSSLPLSGPKRALYQALEDVSSRSSLLGPDADSSSTPGSKEGSGWGAGARAPAHGLDGDATASRNRAQSECIFPSADDASGEAETDLSDAVDIGETVLPLSLVSEPALACLRGAALPVELVSLADRCSRSNQTMAAATVAATATAVALGSKAGGGCTCCEADSVASKPQAAGANPPRVGARQRFVDAVRSSERRRLAAAAATPVPPAEDADAGTADEAVPVPAAGAGHVPGAPVPGGGGEGTQRVEEGGLAEMKDGAAGSLEGGARLFEEGVSRGVAGLQMQYREVVQGGQRSPVDFVVCAVPEVS